MGVAPTSIKTIGDVNVVKIGTDVLIRTYAYEQFPALALTKIVQAPGGSETTIYWLNDPEGQVKTKLNMSPSMTGGAASETIVVDSTTEFAVGNRIIFQENGVNAAQPAYITAIGSATSMTVTALTGNLLPHADNTTIVLAGNRVQYGGDVDQPLRIPTRSSNTIEQVSETAVLPANIAEAAMINEQSVEQYLIDQAMSNFKQRLTQAILFGEEKTAAANSGYASMAGLVNIIPAANKVTAAFTQANFRSFISNLRKRGAFAGNKGLLYVNDAAIATMYGFDDGNTGISWRETDKFLGEVPILGIVFTVTVEPALNDYYRTDKARVIAVTPQLRGKDLIRIQTRAGDGNSRKVLVTTKKAQLEITRFCSLEVRNDYMHGLFLGT